MQGIYPNGVSEPEEFDERKLKDLLRDGAKRVNVFKKNSEEHRKATRRYSRMTKNQKKQFRKQRKN